MLPAIAPNSEKTLNRTIILISLLVSVFTIQGVAQQPSSDVYPKITGYVGIMHPIVTVSKDVPHYNFDGAYVVGIPTGLNLWKSPKIGFSMEFVPIIKAIAGTSKMDNFLFHPGALFRIGKGLTLATRAAFETSGRYGVTPVLNKVVLRGKGCSYFIAVPIPVRFGNSQPTSVTAGFQLGISF